MRTEEFLRTCFNRSSAAPTTTNRETKKVTAAREISSAIVEAIVEVRVRPHAGFTRPDDLAEHLGYTLTQVQCSIKYMCSEYDMFERPHGWGVRLTDEGLQRYLAVVRTYSVPFPRERELIAMGQLVPA